MRCKKAYVALFAATSLDDLAPDLREHLTHCVKCRQRLQRLRTLEGEFQQPALAEVSPEARAAILDRLPAQLPPAAAALLVQPPRPRSSRWALATAAALLLATGLALGWGLAHLQAPAIAPIVASTTAAGSSDAREAAVSRVLETALRLADAPGATEQVNALAEIADELRREALRLTREGPAEDVPLVGDLYERVVYQGLVRRARALPAAQQAALFPELRERLEISARAADRAAVGAPAAVADGLRTLSYAARSASRALQGDAATLPAPRAAVWQPARSGAPRDLLGAVVVQGLALTEEADPLRRADGWAEVADHFVQGILQASATGDAAGAERLGGFLGSVMDRGVVTNIERYQSADPRDERRGEVEKIGGRSSQALQALQRNLDQAPAAAQAGLQRAMEVSKKPKDKDREPKGKAKGRQDRPLPPGQMNKLLEERD